MSWEAWGDDNAEDLSDAVGRYGYSQRQDGRWRETDDEVGLTDEEMWEYLWDRRASDAEDMAR